MKPTQPLNTLALSAPAKVNLFLNLLDPQQFPRPDGYHALQSVMLGLELADTLSVLSVHQKPGLQLSCNWPQLLGPDNLAYKAYEGFVSALMTEPAVSGQMLGFGLTLALEKRIPMQAGLGGGSSNAAAMLQLLQRLSLEVMSVCLPENKLHALAAGLGADVPFFLQAHKRALASGKGEILTPIPLSVGTRLNWPVVIIKPRGLSISTAEAYQAMREAKQYRHTPVEPMLQALQRAKTPAELEPYLLNDFEPVLFERYPALTQTANLMRQADIERPLLCGSGSAMLGFLSPDPDRRDGQRSQLKALFSDKTHQLFWSSLCA